MRGVATVGCVLLGGALGGLLMLPEPQAHAAQPAAVHVGGGPVDLSSDPALLARLLAHRYLAASITVTAAGQKVTASRARFGARVDLTHLEKLLRRAADPRSVMRRIHTDHVGDQPLLLQLPIELHAAQAMPLLKQLKDRVDRAPTDARVDPRKGEVVREQQGVTLDLYATLESLHVGLAQGAETIEAALHVIIPARRIGAFHDIDMSTILASFQTRHSRGDKARNRTHNLRVASAKLDGLVIAPGETFDFNAVVGDRTRAAGFKKAPVIAYGKLVDGMGGGTCQVASTLHAAVFFAGLPVLTRHPHSRPSHYIKMGLDAAVAYGSLNFRFRNDRDYPIVLGVTVESGRVRAAIHGKHQDRSVTFIRRIDEALRFPEKEQDDPKLPRGLRILSQRGVPGFKVTRLRVVHSNATGYAIREKSQDTYPATTQYWRVGTGQEAPPDFELPKNDSHPEYTADEYMKAILHPGADHLEVTRRPGRYGTFGWTEREKMLMPAH